MGVGVGNQIPISQNYLINLVQPHRNIQQINTHYEMINMVLVH